MNHRSLENHTIITFEIYFYSMFRTHRLLLALFFIVISSGSARAFNHADSLRGSNGRGRAWWDVQKYDLDINIDTATRKIKGHNTITFKVISTPVDSFQIDLQEPLIIKEASTAGDNNTPKNDVKNWEMIMLKSAKEGNVWWIKGDFHKWKVGSTHVIFIAYEGAPHEAVRPPWDGGFTWTHDSLGNLWASVSCQGMGASVWWPCKDAQWDEPDSGMNINIRSTSNAMVVSNGKRQPSLPHSSGSEYMWHVANPINNYDATFYLGNYAHWHDTLMGEKGILDLDFYPLAYHEGQARKHFAMVKDMIHCFEYWMGPYPFYEDGYKLVEAPYLGMEHQSAVAYGNNYLMGYKGRDRSGTGIGMNYDFIIVHESGHEWFGNNITAKDIADMWIQEGLTSYSESLYAEWLLGKEKGMEYNRGGWSNIKNDKNIIGEYGVNDEGSGDMYNKGAAIIHMIRVMLNDDEKFRKMLRGLGKEFYHQTVTTAQVEDYIIYNTNLSLKPFFNQYLRTKMEPELEYYVNNDSFHYRFTNILPDFTMPVKVSGGGKEYIFTLTGDWQSAPFISKGAPEISKDFLITLKKSN